MDLSIIIVNWNSVGFLRKCIASVQAETHCLDYEIVVIDSASFDGCDRMLREEFPRVQFLQSQDNVGFARAINAAFHVSRGHSLLFLNPDTEIIGPAVNTMYTYLQTLPEAGAIGCKLLNSDRSIQTSCVQSFPTILNQVLDAEWLRARWRKSRLWGMAPLFEGDCAPRVVEAISGACVMVKRDVFARVGLFSEDYFMYAEDLDLSYKIRQRGYKNYYISEASVIHRGGGSSQEAPTDFAVVMMRESTWRFLRKTRGRGYGLLYRMSMLLSSSVRLALLGLGYFGLRIHMRRPYIARSMRKWLAILRWSLHQDQLNKQYK